MNLKLATIWIINHFSTINVSTKKVLYKYKFTYLPDWCFSLICILMAVLFWFSVIVSYFSIQQCVNCYFSESTFFHGIYTFRHVLFINDQLTKKVCQDFQMWNLLVVFVIYDLVNQFSVTAQHQYIYTVCNTIIPLFHTFLVVSQDYKYGLFQCLKMGERLWCHSPLTETLKSLLAVENSALGV